MRNASARRVTRRIGSTFAIVPLAAALLSGCGHHQAASPAAAPLRVGIIPFEDAKSLRDDFTPMAEYLGKKTGRPSGEVFVSPDYSGILEALRTGQIDCAYLNPLSYVLAADHYRALPQHLVPVAMPWYHHSPTYQGIIFVRSDSGINSLKDLKGKTFAFGDPTSTSGYLYPVKVLQDAGVDPAKDLKVVHVTGTVAVSLVFQKQADAGASYDGAIEKAFPDADRQKQMKVLAKTDPIPNGMFVVRGDVDPKTTEAIKQALLTMTDDPEGAAALKQAKDDKYTPADDHAFDVVRKQASILGLDLKSLDAPKK
jgi:phosphonate transport system substrate-binding protein